MPKKTEFSEWSRKCPNPKCNKTLYYSCELNLARAIRNGRSCNTCRRLSSEQKQKIRETNLRKGIKPPIRDRSKEVHTHFRDCPRCDKEIGHVSKERRDGAQEKGTLCGSCTAIVYDIGKNRTTDASIKKMRATKAGFSSWEEYLEKYPIKKQYKADVWRHTYKQPLGELENYDKRGRMGVKGAYQIDHIISVDEGFKKGISAEVIGNILNIQMLPWKENLTKSNKEFQNGRSRKIN